MVAAKDHLYSNSSIVGQVDLIYSPKCDSNWGLVRVNQGSWLKDIRVEIYPIDESGKRVDTEEKAVGKTAVARDLRAWTTMVDAKEKERQGLDGGQRYCVEVVSKNLEGKTCAD